MSRTRLIAILPLAFALALVGVAPAAAHTGIEGTVPADGETVRELPERFSVTASEELNDITGTGDGFELHIIGPDGTRHDTGEILIEGHVASTPAVVGEPGTYTLAYQVVGEDGHPVAGEAEFTWAPGGEAATDEGATDEGANAQEPPATILTEDDGTGWILPVGIVAGVLVLGALVAVIIARRRTM